MALKRIEAAIKYIEQHERRPINQNNYATALALHFHYEDGQKYEAEVN